MKKDMNRFHEKLFILIIVIASILIVCFTLDYYLPQWKTKKFVNSEAIRIKSCDMVGNVVGIDGWGNPVKYGRLVDPKAVLYTVISAGRDGKFETEDDIVGQAIDLNKSRIVGEWLGKKGVQMVKGIKDGIVAPSKFDFDEEPK